VRGSGIGKKTQPHQQAGCGMLNQAQIKCLAVFAVFTLIGFGPVSPTCLIGLYVVLMRPRWFWQLTYAVYGEPPMPRAPNPGRTGIIARIKCFLGLLALFVVDIAPVPVTSVIAILIVLTRPQWFYRLTANVYGYT